MVIQGAIDSQIVSEIIYEHVHQKFESVHASVDDAQKKVLSFIQSLRSLSEDSENMALQNITRRYLHDLIETFEECVDQFDMYFSVINDVLDSFKTLMQLSAGNVDGTFMEMTGYVLELFITAQEGIEKQMKVVQYIMEEVVNPPTSDQSE